MPTQVLSVGVDKPNRFLKLVAVGNPLKQTFLKSLNNLPTRVPLVYTNLQTNFTARNFNQLLIRRRTVKILAPYLINCLIYSTHLLFHKVL